MDGEVPWTSASCGMNASTAKWSSIQRGSFHEVVSALDDEAGFERPDPAGHEDRY
jgi:hypothetical protein